MKTSDIKRGRTYEVRVSGRVVPVRVNEIVLLAHSGRTAYECTNLATGRQLVVRSAQRFRREATVPPTLTEWRVRGTGPYPWRTYEVKPRCPICAELQRDFGGNRICRHPNE